MTLYSLYLEDCGFIWLSGLFTGPQASGLRFNVQNRLASVEFIKAAGFKLEDVNVVCILFTFLSIWLCG